MRSDLSVRSKQVLIALRLARLANKVRFYAVLGGGGDKPRTHQCEF